MTDTTYYAWAPIAHKNEDGADANLKPGDTIPTDFLNSMDKETKHTWIRDGVIRTRPFPKNVPKGLSVRTHLLREANKAHEEAQKIGSPTAVLDPQAENASEIKPNGESPNSETVVSPVQGDGAPKQ